MVEQQISIPDFRDVLFADAQTQATELGIAVHEQGHGGGVPVEGEEPRVERNADGNDPGTLVPSGYSVGVILYPHEGRR
jgi:hypothetical protein